MLLWCNEKLSKLLLSRESKSFVIVNTLLFADTIHPHRVAKKAVALAPQNQSPWNYLRGLSRRSKAHLPLHSLEDFCLQFSDPQNPDAVRSSHALDVLSEIYAQTDNHEKGAKVLDLLSTRYDPIRANYWNYRKRQLNPT